MKNTIVFTILGLGVGYAIGRLQSDRDKLQQEELKKMVKESIGEAMKSKIPLMMPKSAKKKLPFIKAPKNEAPDDNPLTG